MNPAAATPEEDPTSICFRDSRWLDLFPLNNDTILDYFAMSGFYDRYSIAIIIVINRTCNNELIKMQRLDQEKLLYLKGIEYVLIHSKQPDLYVIKKQKRESPTVVFPQSIYYVIKGTVYQAPTLSVVLSSRTTKLVHYIQTALKQLQKEVVFNPYSGYSWKFNSMNEQSKLKKETPIAENRSHTSRIDKLIVNLSSQVQQTTTSTTTATSTNNVNSNPSSVPSIYSIPFQSQNLKRKFPQEMNANANPSSLIPPPPNTSSSLLPDKKQKLE